MKVNLQYTESARTTATCERQLRKALGDALRDGKETILAVCWRRRAAWTCRRGVSVASVLMLGAISLLHGEAVPPPKPAQTTADAAQVGFASPQEAWEVYRHATHEGQWKKAFRCLTPESQDRFVANLIMSFDRPDADAKRTTERLRAILARHGLDSRAIERLWAIDTSLNGFAKDAAREVRDKEALFDEAMRVLTQVIPKPKGADGKPVVAYGPLTKIETAGDRSKGNCAQQLDPLTVVEIGGVRQREVVKEIVFHRIRGRWFCHMLGGY